MRDVEAAAEAPPFLRVDLQPLLVESERTALYSIAAQLGVLDAVKEKAHPNFCDGLRHVLHLQHLHSGQGAGRLCAAAAQAQSVLFVLHDFEAFAARPKQTLLYSLFDLMQSEDAQMAVVGLTSRYDAVELLEKRVRSRFSQALHPPLPHPTPPPQNHLIQ